MGQLIRHRGRPVPRRRSFGRALVLALGQVPADVPEGSATVATFKRRGTPRARRLPISASFALPVLLGATLGY